MSKEIQKPLEEGEELKLNRKLFILVSILTIIVFGVSIGSFVVILQLKKSIDILKRYLFVFIYFDKLFFCGFLVQSVSVSSTTGLTTSTATTSIHKNLYSNTSTCSSKLAFIQHTKVITKNLKISLN